MKNILGPRKPSATIKTAKVKPPAVSAPDTRVTESEFDVAMTKIVNGQPATINRRISAISQDDAVRQAKIGIPDATSYVQIVAQQIDAASRDDLNKIKDQEVEDAKQNNPGASTQMRAPGGAIPEGFDPSRFSYPYVIGLPSGYENVIGKALRESVQHRYGRIQVVLETQARMMEFVKALSRAKGPAARAILSGIMNSQV